MMPTFAWEVLEVECDLGDSWKDYFDDRERTNLGNSKDLFRSLNALLHLGT
jgi:hypothetical protein